MGTFGKTGIGGSSGVVGTGKVATRQQLTEDGVISKITAYMSRATAGNVSAAIYDDSSGPTYYEPENLKGKTQSVSVSTLGWYDMVYASPLSLTAEWYWLTIEQYYQTAYFDEGSQPNILTDYNGLSFTEDPWEYHNPQNREYSIYATYTLPVVEEKPLISKPLVSPLIVSTPIIRQVKPFSKRFSKFAPRLAV